MKIHKNENDYECDDYGFFCDLEENIESSKKYVDYNKDNKENYDFVIKISSPKKQTHYSRCYHISIGISIIVTAIIIFSIK
jgi:hypothetical protein